MHQSCYQYLRQHPELVRFIRYNPVWYRYLSRDPHRVIELHDEAKKFFGKTFPQRMDKLHQQIQMISMIMQFANMSKEDG